MESGLAKLYRSAIEKMAKSSDSSIERLRRAVISKPSSLAEPTPERLADKGGVDLSQGHYIFDDLRSHGFIRSNLMDFVWFRPNDEYLVDEMAALAGMEAAAIVRLKSLDCEPALPEIRRRYNAFAKIAGTGRALASAFAYQKMMLSIVAAAGQEILFEEYARRASVALAYAHSARLDDDALKGMLSSAHRMIETICKASVRDCTAAASAMRIHPRIAVVA